MIRDARESDLEAIVGIYNAAIPGRLATADTAPVTVESRRSWLRDHDVNRHPIWVAERGGRVIAWLSISRFHERPAYAATAEVGIYVDPAAQRGGVATQLMEHALARAADLGIDSFVALVFAHNDRSVALCRKFGFETWGRLPRVAVLDGVDRDLLILGRRVSAGTEPAQRASPAAPVAVMQIRVFETADEAEVVSLWERCGLVRPWNNPRKDIARKLAVQRELFLVGVIDRLVVASVMAGYDGHRGWINYLAVDPACRGQGLARRMVAAVEEDLRRAGCAKINLQIRRDNHDAVAFYRRVGFGEDAVISMGKRLERDDD
jgi:L-amino acid N-acyltransferase YncA